MKLWRQEYLIEAAGLGIFMLLATLATALIELPSSLVYQSLVKLPAGFNDAFFRRFLIGVLMGLAAIAIIYSPWGKRSGAHINPAVTLTFWRLQKLHTVDACFYILAHCLGGVLGVWLAGMLIGEAIADPAVNYILTQPSMMGEWGAFWAEFAMSFGLMMMVLQLSNRSHLSQLTGLCSGILVAVYITFAAPISGMSINPARSLGSAMVAQVWQSLWIYILAPPLGMLLAAEIYLRMGKKKSPSQICCKLCPNSSTQCLSPSCSGNCGRSI